MPRFAILSHDHPFPHWDFLIEQPDACRTWRLLKLPNCSSEVPAEPLADHRLMYLDYEGPVSGNRGTVTAWDRGSFEWLVDLPSQIQVTLQGNRLNGVASVIQCGQAWTWTFCPEPD
jgi:hypothetical protein